MSLLVTGATGLVGQRLVAQADSKPIFVIARSAERAQKLLGIDNQNIIQWALNTNPLDLSGIEPPINQVVNLMGESIAEGRWTPAKKKRIYDSRVQGTRELVDALIKSGKPPSVFVSASAIGIYGDSGETIVDENHLLDEQFTGTVCRDWEHEAMRLTEFGTRVVCLRIGIVLGLNGGALKKMLPIFRLGIGGKLGSGKQWMSWIHIDDLVSLIQWSLTSDISGPVNATAPNPIRNSEFTRQLAAAVNRPAFLPAPKFALRLALGEFANTLFFSQRIIPAAATNQGFQFQFPNLQSALGNLLNR